MQISFTAKECGFLKPSTDKLQLFLQTLTTEMKKFSTIQDIIEVLLTAFHTSFAVQVIRF